VCTQHSTAGDKQASSSTKYRWRLSSIIGVSKSSCCVLIQTAPTWFLVTAAAATADCDKWFGQEKQQQQQQQQRQHASQAVLGMAEHSKSAEYPGKQHQVSSGLLQLRHYASDLAC
jgi:hypothetical protein